jgi:hypothetical protein
MIRPLRRAHGLVFVVLALLLPLLVIVALSRRPAEPLVDRVPSIDETRRGDTDE